MEMELRIRVDNGIRNLWVRYAVKNWDGLWN